MDEARSLLQGNANKLQDHRIVPLEDIIFDNQIIVRDREGQGSSLKYSPGRKHEGNVGPRRGMGKMFAANNNYVDRAERIELINAGNRQMQNDNGSSLKRNVSE